MAKKAVETESEEVNGNVAVEEAPALAQSAVNENSGVAKDKAYSIVFDNNLKKWMAIEVLFNYANGTLGGVKVIEQNTNKQIINDRFHVLIGQNLL